MTGGLTGNNSVSVPIGVRPVITLNSSALIESGTGTYTDPYVVGPINE